MLLLAQVNSAKGAIRVISPECPVIGHISCIDGEDNDGDGLVDEAVLAENMTATGDDYVADFSDAHCVNEVGSSAIGVVSDATAIGTGNALTKPTPTGYESGECVFTISNATNDTYYAWVLVRNETAAPTSIWVKNGSTLGRNFNNADRSILQTTNPYGWRVLTDDTGAPRTLVLNGPAAIFVKFEQNVFYQSFFLTPDDPATAAPCVPSACGGTPITPDYTLLEIGANAAPNSWNHATLLGGHTVVMTGSSGDPCAGAFTARMVWEDGATKWGYLGMTCADPTFTVSGLSSDTNAFVTDGGERVDFRWRSPPDFLNAFDGSMRAVQISPDDKTADLAWTGGAPDFTQTYINTAIGNEVAGVGWNVFLKFNLGAVTADAVGRCQLTISDKDGANPTLRVFFRGNSNSDGTQFGNCLFSSETVDGAPPATPVVTNFSVGQITSNSAQGTATTTVAGTCRFQFGLTTGIYTQQSSGGLASNLTCQEGSGSVLLPSTNYFSRMCVTNSVAVTGCSSEVSFSTGSASTATLFVGPSVQGNGNCLSESNRCQFAQVWSKVVPGSIIEMFSAASGTTSYQGVNNYIRPPTGLKGTSSNRITIRCKVDGVCFIDGNNTNDGTALVRLDDNDFFTLEGFDVGGRAEQPGQGTQGSGNNGGLNAIFTNKLILRRICAWDAMGLVTQSPDGLIEDFCAFGRGPRKMLNNSQGGDRLEVRRGFVGYFGSNGYGPEGINNAYNARGPTYFQDLITLVDEEDGYGGYFPQNGNGFLGMYVNGHMVGAQASYECLNAQYLGGLYLDDPDFRQWQTASGIISGSINGQCYLFKDHVIMYGGASAKKTDNRAIRARLFNGTTYGGAQLECQGSCNREMRDITEIGWTNSSGIFLQGARADSLETSPVDRGWTITNVERHHSVAVANAAGASPFQTSSGTGARLCFRTEGGVRTTTPLWPFPMDARIKQALTRSGRDPTRYFGPTGLITNKVESVLGAIPAACKS